MNIDYKEVLASTANHLWKNLEFRIPSEDQIIWIVRIHIRDLQIVLKAINSKTLCKMTITIKWIPLTAKEVLIVE